MGVVRYRTEASPWALEVVRCTWNVSLKPALRAVKSDHARAILLLGRMQAVALSYYSRFVEVGDVAKKSTREVPFNGYCNINLTERDVAALDAGWKTRDALLDDFSAALWDGYKFSQRVVVENQSIVWTMMDCDEKSPAYGCVLTAWSRTWDDALATLMYKHFVVAEGRWPSPTTPLSDSTRG